MRRLATLLASLMLLSVFFLSTLDAQTSPSKKSPKPQEKPASTLAREIHHQLAVLPFYSAFDFITFTLDGNKVTLTGQVLRHTLKDSAEAAVKELEGVDIVVNQIEVLPSSPSDDDLRRAIYRALYEDSTLARYAIQNVPPIHVIVKNGAVTLEGSVESLADKNLSSSRAGSVPLVSRVKNNLVVHSRESAAE